MTSIYENATPRPWRYVPWHIEEGPPVCRAPAGHICCTFASDDDAKLAEHAVNNIERLEAINAELLEALELVRGTIEFARNSITHPHGRRASFVDSADQIKVDCLNEVIGELDAAIASAQRIIGEGE